MKIDDASWHYEATDFPEILDPEAGATHIGMFFAWLAFNDLLSEQIEADLGSELESLRKRSLTPGQFVWRFLDGRLSDHDLSDKGRAFAANYYETEGVGNSFLVEYERTCNTGGVSGYFAPDNWQTYERLAPIIDGAYKRWRVA